MAAEKTIPPFSLRGGDVADLRPEGRRVTLVGRRPGIDVSFDSPSVSEIHACLVSRPDGLWLYDLDSRNGTTVNGEPVAERCLRDGDRLAFGKLACTLTLGDATACDLSPVGARLRNTTTGEGIGLSRAVTIVGRRDHCHVHLDDDAVSRVHALFVRCPDGLLVRDTGSRTGVCVNGQPVGEALLTGGEHVTIGRTEFEIEVDLEPATLPAAPPVDPSAALEQAFAPPPEIDVIEEPAEVADDAATEATEGLTDSPAAIKEPGRSMTDHQDDLHGEPLPATDPQQAGSPLQDFLALSPLALRPARRVPLPEEPGIPVPQSVADSAVEAADEELAEQQNRLAAEVEALRHQLNAERQTLAAEQQRLHERLAEQQAGDEQRQAHREALERLESERGELADLKQQIELMRASVEVERNTVEVERRSLAEARKSLEEDTGRLESDHARMARLAEEFAAERETLKKTQDDLARRQEELAEAHGRLDETMARLSADGDRVSADRQNLDTERQQIRQQSEEVIRRESQLRREQAKAQVQAARLADEERLLAERNEELGRRELAARTRSDDLKQEQAQFEHRAARLVETAASARAAEDVARETAEEIQIQTDAERRAVEAAEEEPPEEATAEPATVETDVAEEAVAEADDPPVRAEMNKQAPEPMAEIAVAASRHETTSATDDDFMALMADLHSEDQADEPQSDARLPSLERIDTETRARVAGGRRRMAALIVSAAVVALLALGTAFVLPLLHETGPPVDTTANVTPTDDGAADPAESPKKPVEPPLVAAIDPEPQAPAPPPAVAPEEPATVVDETPPPAATVNETDAAVEVPAEAEPPTEDPASNETDAAPVQPAPPAEPQVEVETEGNLEPTAGTDAEPPQEDETPAEPQGEPPPETQPTDVAANDEDSQTPAEEKAKPLVPGGVWPYGAPENLIPGPPEDDLKPTLTWARTTLDKPLARVGRAFGGKLSAPRQAIAMALDDNLKGSLRKFAPWPYREEVALVGGKPQLEQVTTLVFIEFVYDGKPCLFVLKNRRNIDGSVVPGTPGIFVLVPGAIREHTVVLDPTRDAIREPSNP